MRSRDGSNYFSLTICTLILFNSLALNASEYFISYRYVIKNAVLYNEKLQISKAMQQCQGSINNSITFKNNNNNLKKIISANSQKFINFIHKIGIEIKSNDKVTNGISNSTIILTLKTTCFKVDFNEEFARISALRQGY